MTEDSMVDRVALAMGREWYSRVPTTDGGEALALHIMETMRPLARAAMNAMREPTEKMIEAAEPHFDAHQYSMSQYGLLYQAWQDSIDAALGDA